MNVRTVAIVDPHSTGAELARSFASRGHRCIAVISSPTIIAPLASSFQPSEFAHVIEVAAGSDLGALAARLEEEGVAEVVAGAETGVLLADELCAALQLRGNGTGCSRARRDKFVMVETAAKAGLHTAKQKLCESAAEAAAFAHEIGFPVVVKPLDSAAAENVTVCFDGSAVHEASERVLQGRDLFAARNRAVLVQSYLEGPEYTVNTVSRDGKAYVCEVIESPKRTVNGSPLIYDYYRLLPPSESPVPELIGYTRRLLDALEIKNGAGHTELRMTPEGPALIEIGARAMGPVGATAALAAGTGHDMVDLIADAFDGGALLGSLGETYSFRREAMVAFLVSEAEGLLVEHPLARMVPTLASVTGVDWLVAPGDQVHRTTDLYTILAKIYLAHDDTKQILADFQTIRRWEREHPPVLRAAPQQA